MSLTWRNRVKPILCHSLVFIAISCYLSVLALPDVIATGADANLIAQNCSIRGYVIDSYGTGVTGAEVRLMSSDGNLCMIPDNPVLSCTSESGKAGFFEYRRLQPGSYAITGSKDGYTGSVAIAASEGDTYVELTLPGYFYGRSVEPSSISPESSTAAAVDRSQPATAADNASPYHAENLQPEMWHMALGGCILIAGALTAAGILKKG